MLNKIRTKLEEAGETVFYGRGKFDKEKDSWDCTVFGRRKLLVNGTSKTDYTDRYFVSIIREDYIPQGDELAIIDKLCEIPGMRLSASDFYYNYVNKGNTDTVVEILTLEFSKSKKRSAE